MSAINEQPLTIALADETATMALGEQLASLLAEPTRLYLKGEIGMGKTTLTRALLRQLGVTGAIKSPTFALCEPYTVEQFDIYHYDLYRLSSPEELDYLGWQDDFDTAYLVIVEWPERGEGELPTPSLLIELVQDGLARIAVVTAANAVGERLMKQLRGKT